MIDRILVLGSNSFSGSSFVDSLPMDCEVHQVYRTQKSGKAFESKTLQNRKGSVTQWNLNDDESVILDLMKEHNVKTVVNFAAQSMVEQSWEHPEDWYEANVLSFSRLIGRLQREVSIAKFVQFSTPEVYGNTSGWVRENFIFSPNTPYAISRAAADWHLKALFENKHFPVVFTRAANVYGERQQPYRIIPKTIICALTGQKFPLHGGGRSVRSFIHIDDVSNALIKVVEKGVPGQSYHISTRESISIYELISQLASKLEVKLHDLVEEGSERLGKDYAYLLDSTKIRSELGWEDAIALSEGIDQTIAWVKSNLSELQKLPLHYQHRK